MDKHITKGRFNHDLYIAIRKEREKVGLPVACLNKPILDHELIGREFISKETSKRYTVKSVNEHWYEGWYEILVLEDSHQSSRVVMWRNINCTSEIILTAIDENRAELYILDENGRYVKTC